MIEHGIECMQTDLVTDIKRVDRVCNALLKKDRLMKEVRKHLSLNPKPHTNRVRLLTLSDRFNHTRTNQPKPTVHSLTMGRNVPAWPNCEILDEENPYTIHRHNIIDWLEDRAARYSAGDERSARLEKCPLQGLCEDNCECYDSQKTQRRCRNVNAKKRRDVFGKPLVPPTKLNGCVVNQKLARLQVQKYPIPPGGIDVAPGYFNSIAGRPLKEEFKKSTFNKMQRLVFFKSLFTGHFKDGIRMREEQHRLDLWQLEDTSRELDRVKKTYEMFISQAHEESVSLVKEQLSLEHIRNKVDDLLAKGRGAMTGLKSNIYKRDYRLSTVLLCRDLLLKLSPPTFRLDYSQKVYQNTKKNKYKEDVIELYREYCRYNPETGGKDYFLDKCIHSLIEQIDSLGPPEIYFNNYWEIDMVLRKMELDCVQQLRDLMSVDDILKEVEEINKQSQKYFKLEKRLVQLEVKMGEATYDYEKQRSTELMETTNNEMSTFFKEVICGDHTLEAIALVQVLHEDMFGSSHQKSDVVTMISQIEWELIKTSVTISRLEAARYAHYEKIVNKRTAKERNIPFLAKRRYRESKIYIKRIKDMYAKPLPVGQFCKKLVQRSSIPPLRKSRRYHAASRSEFKGNHLQLDKICVRDDLEKEINLLLRCTIGEKPDEFLQKEEEAELPYVNHSSLRSTVDTESIEKILDSDGDLLMNDKRPSFDVLELGYDSDEQLIRDNYVKRKQKGLVKDEPPVLYDVKGIDDRFMVEAGKNEAGKDRRHHHKPEKRPKMNQLSWR